MNIDFVGGTVKVSGAFAHWPPGCFRYSGVSGMDVYFSSNLAGTGHTSHGLVCKATPAGRPVPYKINLDESAYHKTCKDSSYELITSEAECTQMIIDFVGRTFKMSGAHAHWPQAASGTVGCLAWMCICVQNLPVQVTQAM